MSQAAKIVFVLVVFIAGNMTGIKWAHGLQAVKDVAELKALNLELANQRKLQDSAALNHARAVSVIQNQLKIKNEALSKLSGRECLGLDVVRLLNKPDAMPEPAGIADGAASATPAHTGVRFATDRDVAEAIATCRAGYEELSSQLNAILDLDESNRR